ncbi:MAG: DNA-binding response regulator [Pedosphaera sp.]|nr:DNA-binding response regulator [Pedosphaera sp.]
MNEAANQPARKRLRVVIADDTAAIRESLSALVSRLEDVEIVGLAETGTQALEMIRALKPHVATLDIRMPGINGIKALEAIRHEQLNVAVIVLTGLGEAEYRKKCLSLGAKYFLHKATEFETVIDVLKEHATQLNTSDPSAQNEV